MATNRDIIDQGMQLLHKGLAQYVDQELAVNGKVVEIGSDPLELLNLLLDNWQSVFRQRLGRTEYNLIHELKDTRHRWADRILEPCRPADITPHSPVNLSRSYHRPRCTMP